MVFPDAIAVHDESMGEAQPMNQYMEVAWNYLSNEIHGEQIPMRYEVIT